MDCAKQICLSTIYGIKDCLIGMLSLVKILSAQSEPDSRRENTRQRTSSGQICTLSTVKDKLFQCIIFGIFFWLSNLIYNRVFVQYVFAFFVSWCGEEMDSSNIVWVQRSVYGFFCVTWIFPLFGLSKILNFFWYQKIADMIFVNSGLKRKANMRLSDFIAELSKSLILQMIYCLQGYAVYFLPIPLVIQTLWYVFHLALLTSLYAFEYKWVHMGMPLPIRLLNINRKWPYFLGFGLPLAVVTTCFVSFIDSMIVFATLFPLYVISSAVTSENRSPLCSHPVNTFRFSDSLAEFLITFSMRVFHR